MQIAKREKNIVKAQITICIIYLKLYERYGFRNSMIKASKDTAVANIVGKNSAPTNIKVIQISSYMLQYMHLIFIFKFYGQYKFKGAFILNSNAGIKLYARVFLFSYNCDSPAPGNINFLTPNTFLVDGIDSASFLRVFLSLRSYYCFLISSSTNWLRIFFPTFLILSQPSETGALGFSPLRLGIATEDPHFTILSAMS